MYVPRLAVTLLLLAGGGYAHAEIATSAQLNEPEISFSLENTKNDKIYNKSEVLPLPIAQEYTDDDAIDAMKQGFVPQSGTFLEYLPGFVLGATGSGELSRTNVDATPPVKQGRIVIPVMHGQANLPFTTARSDLDALQTNESYPFRAAGKLFFKEGEKSYICSASLISRGIAVTAAHCVAKFGSNSYYKDWTFIPGFRETTAPFGIWKITKAAVLTSYLNGTDKCQQRGVVCENDVAILVIEPQKGKDDTNQYPGDRTGWFSYGWNRNGFTSTLVTHVTQLGYPGCLDNANLMQRTDAQGTLDKKHSSNTVFGSMMCGGSSGGPLLINFGAQPKLTGAELGFAPTPNQIVGVTSWGSTDDRVKWMGASPFTERNIVSLVQAACKAYPKNCGD